MQPDNNYPTDNEFLDAYNDFRTFPTIQSLADEFGVNDRTIRKWSSRLRQQGHVLINRCAPVALLDAYNDFRTFPTIQSLADEFGVHDRTIRKWSSRLREQGHVLINRCAPVSALLDDEIVEQNVRLAKQKQKQQDSNRIERKSFREDARIENAVAEYASEIADALKTHQFNTPTKFHNQPSDAVGIVHCSDQHYNERVSLPHNSYDWDIAAKREKKRVDTIKRFASCYGMTKLLVAFTGDIINSDRRLDELLGNAGNRAKASVLAVDLIQQMLLDLNEDFDLTVTYVTGNESRIPKDIGWQSEVATDNYDFAVMEMLRLMLDSSGIHFEVPQTPSETVVEVNGQNVLIIHGHSFRKNVEVDIQRCKSKYLAHGIMIDLVIFGHIHNAMITDTFSRSGSVVGDNEYSAHAGHYESRASQNFYVLHANGGFDGIKVDLHNTDGIQGYDLSDRLKTYHTKRSDQGDTILHVPRIVI